MNFYLLSIIAFGVFVAILYLKSSEHVVFAEICT